MLEKRNLVSTYRTPQSGFDKTASIDEDDIVDEIKSEFTKKAIEEDEKSDKEYFESKK